MCPDMSGFATTYRGKSDNLGHGGIYRALSAQTLTNRTLGDIMAQKTYKVTTRIGTFRVRAYDADGAITRVALITDSPVKSVKEA